ncbi:MAG: tetratricopeptide repeat protein [Chloroflexota bacterium]
MPNEGKRGQIVVRQKSSSHQPSNATDAAASELLARLGLETTASPDELASAHDEVIAFLATAPRHMRTWARTQATATDEAYAVLSDPTALQQGDPLQDSGSGPQPGGSAPQAPAARSASASTTEEADADTSYAPGSPGPHGTDDDSVDAIIASVTPSAHRDAVGSPADAADSNPAAEPLAEGPSRAGGMANLASHRSLRKVAIVAVAVVALGVVAAVGYFSGTPSVETPTTSDAGLTVAPQPSFDAVRVAALMTRLQDDPTDDDALVGLGDEYFTIGDFSTAAEWFRRALAIDPERVETLLALGAATFNQGDIEGAEMQWQEAIRLDPGNIEAHYDLGFVYLNRTPPDMVGLEREWGEVVRLAPDSEVAKTVTAHLEAFASPDPIPGASAAPASPIPAATPATSATP